ncbi:MAG: hypothetical protein HXY40_08045 [Chloroflexi bacterium]|nr:hypothetical protein [Chloroflexota bacterium]
MPRLTVWMVRTALLYLGAGFSLGALLLANKGLPLSPEIWRLLFPHIEAIMLGWTFQLALGVAFWILPRHPQRPKYGYVHLAWAGYILLNAGVLLVIGGEFFASEALTLAGRLVEGLAVAAFAVQLWPRVKAFGV